MCKLAFPRLSLVLEDSGRKQFSNAFDLNNDDEFKESLMVLEKNAQV
ncbi:hypothetical protein [Pedobacter gandavensis]|nr:hypothetical protein [Pedobacter gandavensis]